MDLLRHEQGEAENNGKWNGKNGMSEGNAGLVRLDMNNSTDVRFEVFTAVTMKSGVFWDVTPCGLRRNIPEDTTLQLYRCT
jgi:hypothetical protein